MSYMRASCCAGDVYGSQRTTTFHHMGLAPLRTTLTPAILWDISVHGAVQGALSRMWGQCDVLRGCLPCSIVRPASTPCLPCALLGFAFVLLLGCVPPAPLSKLAALQ